jgi:alcohol oxidase
MVYTRASASDYDAWKHQFGNPGWGSEDLIPLLKGVETYEPFTCNASAGLTHGTEGPLGISFKHEHINLAEQFLDVAGKYDTARSVGEDFNDFKSGDKYAVRWPIGLSR